MFLVSSCFDTTATTVCQAHQAPNLHQTVQKRESLDDLSKLGFSRKEKQKMMSVLCCIRGQGGLESFKSWLPRAQADLVAKRINTGVEFFILQRSTPLWWLASQRLRHGKLWVDVFQVPRKGSALQPPLSNFKTSLQPLKL
eukprot:4990880-Amphidinium_carterae.1